VREYGEYRISVTIPALSIPAAIQTLLSMTSRSAFIREQLVAVPLP
jgi:hypothetical protein